MDKTGINKQKHMHYFVEMVMVRSMQTIARFGPGPGAAEANVDWGSRLRASLARYDPLLQINN